MNIKDTYASYEKYLVFFLRILIGATFIYSGFTKFAEPFKFETIVGNYAMLPKIAIHPFATLLPWIEVLVGAALVLGILKRHTSYIILLMLLMFIVAVSYQIMRGNSGDCGCGLPGEDFTQVLIRDFVMFAATVLIARTNTEFLEILNRDVSIPQDM
jgi:uncharacterized membrane protein YphA (DoxX/SURF4 family)